MKHRILALAAALCLATFGVAGGEMLTPEEHAMWRAIGRVNLGGLATRSACTGVLVAPDLVLTAGHCAPQTAIGDAPPEDLHFVAGWHLDTYAAHRTVTAVFRHPDHVEGRRGVEQLHSDIALLVLDEPIPPTEVTPLPLAAMPSFADDVEIIGYSNHRPGALARSGPCTAVTLRPDLLGMTCAVVGGNSGAPVLRQGEDGWHVVAIAIAADTGGGGFHSYAAGVAPALFDLAGRAPP